MFALNIFAVHKNQPFCLRSGTAFIVRILCTIHLHTRSKAIFLHPHSPYHFIHLRLFHHSTILCDCVGKFMSAHPPMGLWRQYVITRCVGMCLLLYHPADGHFIQSPHKTSISARRTPPLVRQADWPSTFRCAAVQDIRFIFRGRLHIMFAWEHI